MVHHLSMQEFFNKYGQMEKEAFVSRLKTPFLVVELDPKDKSKDSRFKTLDNPGEKERSTTQVKSKEGPLDVRKFLAVPLMKSDRNTFHNMITLGRSSNNDVVIPHPSVSKLHAIFRVDSSGAKISVSDAGSSFGTQVNTQMIEKNVEQKLESGDTIRFADSVKSTVLVTEDFYDYLHLHNRMPR